MDRLSMRYMDEPWPERKRCVSMLLEIDRWHTYGLLSAVIGLQLGELAPAGDRT